MTTQTMGITPGLIDGPEMTTEQFHALAPSEKPWSINATLDKIHNELGYRGQGTVGCIIDDGCMISHENFRDANGLSRVIHSESFVKGESATTGASHGTHVMGILGGKFTGIAPDAKLINMKGLSRNGSGSSADLTRAGKAITQRFREGKIPSPIVEVNMSYGGGYYPPQEDQLEESDKAGIGNTASAGNAGGQGGSKPTCGHPGTSKWVVTSASIDKSGKISSFSSQCSAVDVASPGGNILSSTNNGGYGYKSGTSMSGPWICGMKLLIRQAMWEQGKKVISTADQWTEFFKLNTTDLGKKGHDWIYGAGVLDLLTLLKRLADGKLKYV